jgi:hypothetical protein
LAALNRKVSFFAKKKQSVMKNIVKKLFVALPFRDPCGRLGHRGTGGTPLCCKDGKRRSQALKYTGPQRLKMRTFPPRRLLSERATGPVAAAVQF